MNLDDRMRLLAAWAAAGILYGVSAPAAAWDVPVPAPAHAPTLKSGEPAPPGGDRGFDVLSYDLDLRLDPATRTIAGRIDVGFGALAAGLDSLRLDLVSQLTVASVTRRGTACGFRHEGDALAIALVPEPAADAADTVTITWSGRPPAHGPFGAGLMFRTHDAGTREDPADDQPIVANVSQPWSSHSWWPCKDLPDDKAALSTAVTVPAELSVMANGTLLDVADADPGWRTWHWREAYPIAPYLVSVAISNYVGWDEECEAAGSILPLQFRVFPQDSAAAAVDFAPTCRMVGLMTDLAGPWPFPGEKYAQAEIKWIGAMEHQTATSYSQYLLTGDGYWQSIVIHELAHQWFGDSLTPATWQDLWLNEGFARYCEALWVERSLGPAAYREFMQRIGARRHPDLFTEQGLLGDPDPILPNLMVYDKGAWLLHSLRQLVGDEAFFRFLLDYAGDPALVHRTVTSDDAQAAAERASGRDLSAFFDAWLETSAAARLGWSWSSAPGPGGTGRLLLTVEQQQDPVFPVALPVVIATTAGVQHETAVLEERSRTFRFAVAAPVVSVTVDPDTLVLMSRAPAPAPPVAVAGPWPNPLGGDGGRFTITPLGDGPVTVRVHDARGRLAAAHDLGEHTGGEAFTWDWRPASDDARPLPSGVYWLEFRASGGRAVRKAVLVR